MSLGVIEEISWRRGEQVSVEWRIPNFPSLLDGEDDRYGFHSSDFSIGDVCWMFRLWPNWEREARNPESGWVRLDLDRFDGGPPETFRFSLGIRGSGGVEKSREVEKEIGSLYHCCSFPDFCSRSYLLQHRTRLMPDDTFTVTCVLKRPSADRGKFTYSVLHYSYLKLQTATQNFSDLPLRSGGCKIGEGGFSTVYRAVIGDNVVAVKRLKVSVETQFNTELRTLTNYKHENLLPLIGFSVYPPDQGCLLYEYMPNGSLQDRLACADGSEPLSWRTRLCISYGTALGINHLHTFGEKPMVHRDIKSANILLDQNFVPKVGDFGFVRTGSRGVRSSTQVFTENNSGTLVYMPREAQFGDVSIKWDTFSFGVILLELLTGLPPLDSNREDIDLVTHMTPCKDIRPKLDPRTDWNREAAKELYKIAQRRCLVQKSERSTISEILEDLRILSSAEKKTKTKKSFFSGLLKMK